VAKQVVDTIKNPQLNDQQRLDRYGRIFDFAIDTPLIARIAAGRHLRRVTAEQKKRYFASFNDYIVAIYADRFGGHCGATLSVISELKTSKSDTLVYVKIHGPKISPKDTVFRVRKFDHGYKIADVVVDGVSLILTKRAEFNSIIYREGFEGLLGALKNKQLKAPSPTRLFNAF
jgi:phospholipid transport system substrate-binding protein